MNSLISLDGTKTMELVGVQPPGQEEGSILVDERVTQLTGGPGHRAPENDLTATAPPLLTPLLPLLLLLRLLRLPDDCTEYCINYYYYC